MTTFWCSPTPGGNRLSLSCRPPGSRHRGVSISTPTTRRHPAAPRSRREDPAITSPSAPGPSWCCPIRARPDLVDPFERRRSMDGRMVLASVCFLDRDPDAFRPHLAHRDTDLEDSPLIAGGDVLGVHLGGQPDQPGERAVTEL